MAEMQRKFGEYLGQNIIAPGKSELFGKNYLWLQDKEGTIYTVRLDDNDVLQWD